MSRRTIEQRLVMRAAQNRRRGRADNWAVEALDYYLSGIPPKEIAEALAVSVGNVYNAICKEALYRLMRDKQRERLEEIPELSEDKNR